MEKKPPRKLEKGPRRNAPGKTLSLEKPRPSLEQPRLSLEQPRLSLEQPRLSLERDEAGAESRKSVRQNHDEVKLYGVNACQTLARRRIEDIVRVYVTEERIKNFGHVLSWCAQNKRAYHVVTGDEMEKIAETMHHEGVCMLAKARRMADFTTLVGREKSETGASSILFLENIGNSHNLGAILRVASHFGVTAVVVVSEDSTVKSMAPSVFRVAEGGAETVDVAFVNDAVRALRALKHAGYTLVATSSHMKDSLYTSRLPQRVVFLFGSETNGLSTQSLREADKRVAIPGTGNVESLNVSCAATAILGEFWRTHKG